MESDVAAFLSDHDPSVPLKHPNNLIKRKTWNFRHTETSRISIPGIPIMSSSTDSMYSSMASLKFSKASAFVSP